MDARLPDALLNNVVSILPPPAAPDSHGGRQPIDHSTLATTVKGRETF